MGRVCKSLLIKFPNVLVAVVIYICNLTLLTILKGSKDKQRFCRLVTKNKKVVTFPFASSRCFNSACLSSFALYCNVSITHGHIAMLMLKRYNAGKEG